MSTTPQLANPAPSKVFRFFPSLTDVAFLLPVVFLVWKLGGAKNMLEGDTGWHLRTGEWILANGRVPDRDFFSYTRPGEPWFAWEWLWDVAFARLHLVWGLPGVVLVSLLVICLTSALLFRLIRRKCPNAIVAFAVTWVAMAGSSVHWWARPHVFTMLFVVAAMSILERAGEGRRRGLLWLPLLMALWVNVHGGFVAGLIVIACYAAGEALSAAVALDRFTARQRWSAAGHFGAALAACGAATFANPYGARLHVHIWKTLTDPESPLYRFVGEWQPMAIRGALAYYVEPVVVLAVAAAVWYAAKRDFVYPLLVLSWMHSSFSAVRNLPIFLMVAAPPAAAVLLEGFERLRRAELPGWLSRAAKTLDDAASDFGEVDRIPRLHLASIAGAVVLGIAFLSPAPPERLRARYDPERFPVKAVDSLTSASAVTFTADEWGDYLIYRLYPRGGKVFMDGRFDFYGGKFTERYVDLMNVKYDWEKTLRQYGVNTILLQTGAPLASTLKESARWRAVYDDGTAIVFRMRVGLAGAADVAEPRTEAASARGTREEGNADTTF